MRRATLRAVVAPPAFAWAMISYTLVGLLVSEARDEPATVALALAGWFAASVLFLLLVRGLSRAACRARRTGTSM